MLESRLTRADELMRAKEAEFWRRRERRKEREANNEEGGPRWLLVVEVCLITFCVVFCVCYVIERMTGANPLLSENGLGVLLLLLAFDFWASLIYCVSAHDMR